MSGDDDWHLSKMNGAILAAEVTTWPLQAHRDLSIF